MFEGKRQKIEEMPTVLAELISRNKSKTSLIQKLLSAPNVYEVKSESDSDTSSSLLDSIGTDVEEYRRELSSGTSIEQIAEKL